MKITVLGRGNAGCLTALYFSSRPRDDIQIELIFDKDISPEKVGQGTLLDPPKLLWETLGIDWYNNPIDATPKAGILYENWGKKKEKSFASAFPLDRMALHFSPKKFQDTVLESGLFDVTERHIENYNEIDSDYIFDCRGKPTDNWDDYEELKNPVNAVFLAEDSKRDLRTNWTRAVATPDGWCFVIPNTSNTTSYGYLYNHQITSYETAKENFEKLFEIGAHEQFEFKQYVAKKPIIDDRIILNGNRLFFLEPLEATAIQAYYEWLLIVSNWILSKNTNSKICSLLIRKYIHEVENFILWHYLYGSTYDTPFWDYAKEFKIDDFQFLNMLKMTNEEDLIDLRRGGGIKYGQWQLWNFRYWLDAIE
jgi:hypothetical protein